MYVSMKDMLLHAHRNNYAVMAINCVNMEQVKAVIESAEEEKSAVIINISPRQMKAHGYGYIMAPLIENLAKRASVPVPSLRMMLCGSSYMPVEKLKQLHKWLPTTEIRTVFGMTETASPGTLFPTDTALSIYPSSSGRPVPGLELKILDDDGHEVETGTVGTVYIRGANVVEYYYKMESPLFTEDGWLDTGDMGYQNEDAFVFFVDRKKDMVNRGGEKIWCTDVEDELIAFKGVKDAAVVGIPNEKYGEVAAAVVVLEKGAQLTEEQIKEEMLKEMARFKVPERILFLDAIPKTPGLKTDKKYIRTLFQ